MKKYIIIMIVMIFSTKLKAQDDNLDKALVSSDTVFILLSQDEKAYINGKRTVKADEKYPKDMSRRYFLDDNSLSFNNLYFTRPDLEAPFFFIEPKEKFRQRDFILSNDLADKSVRQVQQIMKDKVLMLVDPTFSDTKYHYLVRVFRYAGEE